VSPAEHLSDDEPRSAHAASISRSLWQILWRRKALILVGAVAGLVIGTLVYSQQPAVYQSSAKVLVIKKRDGERVLNTSSGSAGASYAEDYLSTHVEVLKSPEIIARAVQKRELHALKSFENRGDPVGIIAATLAVERDKPRDTSSGPSNIINLSYRGPVSDDCPRVLNAIIDTYRDILDEYYQKTSDLTLKYITDARDVLKNDLADAEKKYSDYMNENVDLLIYGGGAKEGNIYQREIRALRETRAKLKDRKTELADKIRAVEYLLEKGLHREALVVAQRDPAEVKPAPGADRDVEAQLLLLQLKEQELLEDHGADSPAVKSVRKRIALAQEYLKKQSAREDKTAQPAAVPLDPVQRYLFSLRHELSLATRADEAAEKELVAKMEPASVMSKRELEAARLRNDARRLEEFYEGTRKRLTEMNLTKDAGGFNAQVLTKPGPGGQIAPNMMMTLMAGFFLGGLAGIGLAYLAELSDRGFRSSEEVRLRLGLPLVGHIPFLKPNEDAVLRAAAGEPTPDPLLVSHHQSMSVEAEAYRAVRTALYFGTQGEGRKVIQVTSPSKGDGKSLLIANLAVSIAQSGKKVILVDADCRRPRQHKVFALSAAVGLVDVVGGAVELAAAVQPTCVPGLDVLPAGPVRPNPAELLSSPRFHDLLDSLRGRYDYILVDTPPLLAVTDPCVVASRVDGLFLVIRLTRDARPRAEHAREILTSLSVKVFGVVVNGITRQGGAGLYSTERYDYVENYEATDDEDAGDGYYQADPEPGAAEAGAGAAGEAAAGAGPTAAAAVEPVRPHRSHRASGGASIETRGGLLRWLFRWWA
jgi:capsular exopolysaccharide synthesis family protein